MQDVFTKTADTVFNQYIEQCYLDNFLRGGYPLVFRPDVSGKGRAVSSYNAGSTCGSNPGSKTSKNIVYHVFSRKHGDIERKYNFFSLEPSYYSQGNGNFRDVNQNRRNDVLIKPEIMDFNVKQMMSLIQADGYNPLVVKCCTFVLEQDARNEIMSLVLSKKEEVGSLLSTKFTPGALVTCIREHKTELATDEKNFLQKVLEASHQEFEAEFGEGFWSDHWTYNLEMFDQEGKVSFRFLGRVQVTYHNPLRAATFGEQSVKPKKYMLTTIENKAVEIEGNLIHMPYAQMVRDGRIIGIVVYLG